MSSCKSINCSSICEFEFCSCRDVFSSASCVVCIKLNSLDFGDIIVLPELDAVESIRVVSKSFGVIWWTLNKFDKVLTYNDGHGSSSLSFSML